MSCPTIAVVGNPNSGKTTLFNALTGSTQRVGNWPGVTVEKKEGYFIQDGNRIKVVDLPGIYSLSATSEDERVALDYILSGDMDIILNILDATNLERNLYLTIQLTEMNVPLVIAVNMLDIADKRGIKIDLEKLSAELGVPVYGITAIKKGDADELKAGILEHINKKPVSNVKVLYPLVISEWLDGRANQFSKSAQEMNVPERWLGLKVLENNKSIIEKLKKNNEFDIKEIDRSFTLPGSEESPEITIIESRYRYIQDLYSIITGSPIKKGYLTEKIDKIVLNRVLGIPIFFLVMYLVFWVTLSIGGSFIDFFDIAVGALLEDGLAHLLASIGSPGWLITIVASGIGAGIKTVSTFIPIVFTMFLCLSVLEDSGYMARAAFVMDRFMRTIGLPGKSFVPMLIGFGCTVPAVMATRTLDSTRDRILTIFMTPFMSCGARLPVYALFGAAFFGSKAGLMVFSLYLAGGILAIFTGLLLKNTLFKGEPSHFIMELPPYHTPRLGSILRSASSRLKAFIVKAGKVIVVAVAVLGFMNSFGVDGTLGNEGTEKSVLSVIGSNITPIFEPMGVEKENWPATVALFTGLFAKEAVVGTLNSLYSQIEGANESVEEDFNLFNSLQEALLTIPENLSEVLNGLFDPFGLDIIGDDEAIAEAAGTDKGIYVVMQKYFSEGLVQVYAYLLFILLYVPCMAAVGAIVREIGAKLTIVLSVYQTVLGWVMATIVYQVGIGHNWLWIIVSILILAGVALFIRYLGSSKVAGSV